MTRVVDAMREMGLTGETSALGRWIRIPGERGPIYVLEAAWGVGYYTWCDAPDARTAELYRDPREAILAGLRRAGDGDETARSWPDRDGARTDATREGGAPESPESPERRDDRPAPALAGGMR